MAVISPLRHPKFPYSLVIVTLTMSVVILMLTATCRPIRFPIWNTPHQIDLISEFPIGGSEFPIGGLHRMMSEIHPSAETRYKLSDSILETDLPVLCKSRFEFEICSPLKEGAFSFAEPCSHDDYGPVILGVMHARPCVHLGSAIAVDLQTDFRDIRIAAEPDTASIRQPLPNADLMDPQTTAVAGSPEETTDNTAFIKSAANAGHASISRAQPRAAVSSDNTASIKSEIKPAANHPAAEHSSINIAAQPSAAVSSDNTASIKSANHPAAQHSPINIGAAVPSHNTATIKSTSKEVGRQHAKPTEFPSSSRSNVHARGTPVIAGANVNILAEKQLKAPKYDSESDYDSDYFELPYRPSKLPPLRGFRIVERSDSLPLRRKPGRGARPYKPARFPGQNLEGASTSRQQQTPAPTAGGTPRNVPQRQQTHVPAAGATHTTRGRSTLTHFVHSRARFVQNLFKDPPQPPELQPQTPPQPRKIAVPVATTAGFFTAFQAMVYAPLVVSPNHVTCPLRWMPICVSLLVSLLYWTIFGFVLEEASQRRRWSRAEKFAIFTIIVYSIGLTILFPILMAILSCKRGSH